MSSKVAIISTANIKHMTLVSMYTSILDDLNISYDLIYFDRYDIEESSNAENVYRFTEMFSENIIRQKKIKYFLRFRKFAKALLVKNNYRLIIVWNTLTALLFADILLKMPKKYILNIRDYYYENNQIIYKIHGKLIEKSFFTTISSKGFQTFLPKNKYIFVNSYNKNLFEKSKTYKKKQFNDTKIRIGFIGNVRFIDQQIKFINHLANDKRFEVWYCGTNSEIIQEYVKYHDIENVVTIGQFKPEETVEIIENFDIINNMFGNESIAVNTLTPIRLYYSVEFELPIISNKGTYVSNLISDKNIGLSIDLDKQNVNEEIYSYYINYDRKKFSISCKTFKNEILEENITFIKTFKNALNKNL